MILLEGKDWEAINKKARVDVLDIVINLDGRYTPTEQANLIVKRCDLATKAQAKKIYEWGNEDCPHSNKDWAFEKRVCDACWQELLKEVE